MFEFSDTNKSYHTFDYHLKNQFGGKISKISLNAGFTCPNIDGTKGKNGCIYCSDLGSGDFGGSVSDTLYGQFEKGKKLINKKWKPLGYLAYFQARTNTYAAVEYLRSKFEPVLSFPDVKGLCIATRADCISQEIADYLFDLSKRTYLIVELGLQTINDKTAEYINRCHSYAEFLKGFSLLKERGIQICVHLINGLPFETPEDMVLSAKTVGELGIHSIKLHMLQILSKTPIARLYANEVFGLLTMDEYIDIVCRQLAVIPKEVVIQRLTGDGDHSQLIAPLWCKNKKAVLNGIDKEMVNRNIFQGSLL